MLCTAADQARKIDPQIAAKYQRLMAGDRHHDSAICTWPPCWSPGSLPACATASPTSCAMSTAPPDHRRSGPQDRQRALSDRAPAPRQHPSPTHARPPQTGGGPGVTGVAKRSNIQARQTRAYEPTRRLTSVRNSSPAQPISTNASMLRRRPSSSSSKSSVSGGDGTHVEAPPEILGGPCPEIRSDLCRGGHAIRAP